MTLVGAKLPQRFLNWTAGTSPRFELGGAFAATEHWAMNTQKVLALPSKESVCGVVAGLMAARKPYASIAERSGARVSEGPDSPGSQRHEGTPCPSNSPIARIRCF